MHMIDSSLYASQRTIAELQTLASAGLSTVIEPVTFLGTPRTSVGTFLDEAERLTTVEAERCALVGVEHLVLLGVTPRDTAHVEAAHRALDHLPSLLERPGVVGIGEVGLETCGEAEIAVLRRQLRIARSSGMPIVIQAPTRRKARAVEMALQLAADERVDRQRLLVKGLDEDTVALVKRFGAWAGLTIHPAFLTQDRMVRLIGRFGTEGIMLQSDAGRGFGDPYALPAAMHRLAEEGLPGDLQAQLLYHNPKWFFGQGVGRSTTVPAGELVGARR